MNGPGSIRFVDPTIAQFDRSTSAAELRALATHPRLKVLQCASPMPDQAWQTVNTEFLLHRPDVTIRVYGGPPAEWDLSFVRQIPTVRHFAADCLASAYGVETLAELSLLESLSLGIFDLHSFEFLQRLSPRVQSLRLDATRSRRISLVPLAAFRSLRQLSLDGHSAEIGVLSELPALEDLTLRSITAPDLAFLNGLPKLWSLDIKLGGITNLASLAGKSSIKYLELWQVRELRNIDVIGSLPGLQNLFLQSLPHIAAIPQLAESPLLRRFVIENLKGLGDFSALETAPSLEEFRLIDGRAQVPQQLVPALRNSRLKEISAGFGSARKNLEFERLRLAYSKQEFAPKPFEYR